MNNGHKMMHIIHLYNKLHADCLLLGSHLKIKHMAGPLDDFVGAIPGGLKRSMMSISSKKDT